jgi:5-methylcytosine-specific restriction protein A
VFGIKIIKNKAELDILMQKFKESLIKYADEKIKTQIGFQGYSFKAEVYYSRKLNIWFYFGTESNRYWNAFGIGHPASQVSIVVEINIPFKGIDRRIAGVFVKDGDGRVWLGYRGRIGGGRRGIGRKTFWKEYSGDKSVIQDNGKTDTYAKICYLDSPDFPERIKNFVIEVNEIKRRRVLK